MSVKDKIKKFIAIERAFEPRYKHLRGQHDQKKHGYRGAVAGQVSEDSANYSRAEKLPGTSAVAQRMVNAQNDFYSNVTEQFGFSRQEAETILSAYIKAKAVKLDVMAGKYQLKHGAFWDKEVMQRALQMSEKPQGSGVAEPKTTVYQQEPGGRAVGGAVTIGMNQATYAGGQFLPSTTLQKMTSSYRKIEKKYATEEEKYLNTKQEIQPYVWEKPPSTDHSAFHYRISGHIPHSGYRETYRYDTERAKAMKPPYPNKEVRKQPRRDETGKLIVPSPESKWVPMTRQEWLKEIELADRFNRGERWETGRDTERAKMKIGQAVFAFVKEGRTADEIKLFFTGKDTLGVDVDDLIYRAGMHFDYYNGNYRYENW